MKYRTGLACALAMILSMMTLVAQEPRYTPAQLFSGTLYLATTEQLTSTQASILNAEIERTNNEGWLVGLGSRAQAERSGLWKLLAARAWVDSPLLLDQSQWNDTTSQRLQEIKRGSCVWLDDAQLRAIDPDMRAVRARLLRQCLDRGALIVIEATHADHASCVADGYDLVPDLDVVRVAHGELGDSLKSPQRARLQLATGCLLRIGRREVANISDTSAPQCSVDTPATAHYSESQSEKLVARTVVDLVAIRRALIERQQPVFPADQEYQPRLTKGSLVIVGGGGTPSEIWEKFVELAGGKAARIVVLPTAMPEPELEETDEAELFKRMGVQSVKVLPQTARQDVSQPEFLEHLRSATGVWFGGGRQWRFVDAYWATPAWHEIQQVVARGGVIGGSSAGATIQGDLLVRGHPLGNQIMVADGYRHGLGLLEGVAIDQHFKQRNRFDDLAGVWKRFPRIYGIGIDESTALVVQSPQQCQVLGKGSVWILRPGSVHPKPGEAKYAEYSSGATFDLTSNEMSP